MTPRIDAQEHAPRKTAALAQQAAFPDREWELALRTHTRVDTGSWWGKRKLWVFATPQRLTLVATGPKPYVHVLERETFCESFYNHITATVTLAPYDGQTKSLRIPPAPAWRLLQTLTQKEKLTIKQMTQHMDSATVSMNQRTGGQQLC